MTSQEIFMKSYQEDLLGVFGNPSLVLTDGEGATVTDADGKKYLDLLAGIAVNSLGYGHPAWAKAVAEQASHLAHVSNFFTTPQQLELADSLLKKLDSHSQARVFFCNSGTEANEVAYKLARRHGNVQGKKKILALDHAFHGRTIGALALTWKSKYREPFAPMPEGVEHIPATIEALEEHLTDEVAALIVEPIQGEAGVLPLPEGYLTRARELTREKGALFIVDEVQTGMGRTGRWFECTRELGSEDLPDAITLAKGLGGGFPIGAMIVNGQENIELLEPGMHGTTFGGNPLACAAGIATLNALEDENLLEHATQAGSFVRAELEKLDVVESTRGSGLLIGVVLKDTKTDAGAPLAPAAVNAAREAGFIINAPDESTLRLAPTLVVTEEELLSFAKALPEIVETAKKSA